ncbi:hypothetical protein ACOQFV_08975 [Nocardiopsis changdeensis]|uniref:Uncharacterized protein n=1 Tax=Nocardiopsis changdeensis TaxID=2831969 RepID=A0ABX8BDK0_9ACTN|nr:MULTISPECIES: hypothetical protein [Nocardiopsis]QUX20325.1 hypothetical protein KGD84_17505 [Nocardiopsis changdeensis]QYX36255.1 hypothetical protein K1J57_26960 [Nocardiopsis sp. MT53]
MATNVQLAQQAQDSMRAAKRFNAIVELSTGIEWATSSGEAVRVAPHGDGWGVFSSGVLWGARGNASAAVDLAARILPPADADLAALLTWTACGKPRI